ncbi:putative membrane protein [Thermasporomyces composti]|uniref:Putative membrane protein n=1 Tax=Thermasporomyces composti TaxID=696763 RepID=A0A3D9V987_THECX|nr:putative membrane protein [Thermasporomyces composti]
MHEPDSRPNTDAARRRRRELILPTRERDRLDIPRVPRRSLRPRYEPDLLGRFAESFAKFMGTGKFIAYMTVFVLLWVAINLVGAFGLRWDPYPFILLNLFFSVQASYAAPLILLAQNRQEARDRVQYEQDRDMTARTRADMEFLAREMASLRTALGESATRDFVRSELRALLHELDARLGPPREQSDENRRRAEADPPTSAARRGDRR